MEKKKIKCALCQSENCTRHYKHGSVCEACYQAIKKYVRERIHR